MEKVAYQVHDFIYFIFKNFLKFLKNVSLFILREGGRERTPSRLPAVFVEPDAGLELTNREIMT